MNNLFIIQLIVSFIAGGVFISVLSLIAERVNTKIAGIVLAFPSTAALGFFFLGWSISPGAVADAVPATLIPLGLCVLYPAIYANVADLLSVSVKNKLIQITLSFITGITVWLALVIPITIYKVQNKFTALAIGISGYFALIVLSHFLLQRKSYVKPQALVYTPVQKIFRAVFIGLIVALVVYLGKMSGVFWGGVFAMFPAAFSSSLILIHMYYGTQCLFPAAQKIPVGSISIFIYTITVMFVFPVFGLITGTVIAYLAGILATIILLKVQRGKEKDLNK